MEEKDGVNASQQKELLEFHIDGYEIEELHSSAFELIKRSFFMFFFSFPNLIFWILYDFMFIKCNIGSYIRSYKYTLSFTFFHVCNISNTLVVSYWI